MNEQAEILIRELAEKLGIATEHLWGVLIRQAPIDGGVSAILLFLFGCIGYFLFKFCYKESDEEYWIMFAAYAIAYSFYMLVSIHSIFAAFLNPEYWALQQLLNK